MDDANKRIWRQRIGLYGGVLLMLVVCWVFIWAYRTITIRRYGADLIPKKQVESVQTPFYSMEDPAYAQQEMGQTGYTIGQQGQPALRPGHGGGRPGRAGRSRAAEPAGTV